MCQDLLRLPVAQEDRQVTSAHRPQPRRAEAEEILRDIAYVLHLTRRVRSEIEVNG